MGGTSRPNSLHFVTNLVASNSLFDRPAASTFACSSKEKFLYVNDSSMYFLYKSKISLCEITPGFVKLYTPYIRSSSIRIHDNHGALIQYWSEEDRTGPTSSSECSPLSRICWFLLWSSAGRGRPRWACAHAGSARSSTPFEAGGELRGEKGNLFGHCFGVTVEAARKVGLVFFSEAFAAAQRMFSVVLWDWRDEINTS